MSLIVQTLNKLKSKGRYKPVPPGLRQQEAKTQKNRRLIVYTGIIVILSAILSIILVNSHKMLYRDTENLLALKEVKEQKKEKIEIKSSNPSANVSGNKFSESETPADVKRNVEKKNHTPAPQKVKKTVAEKKTVAVKRDKPEKNNINPTESDYAYNSYINMANRFLENGNYLKSLEYYEKAYQLKPTQKILKNIILLKITTGRKDGISAYINKLSNDRYIADVILGLINTGNTGMASELLDIFLSREPSPFLLYAKGVLLEKEGKFQHALVYYKKAYQMKPDDPYIGYAYGRILEINRQYKNAVNIYRAVIKLEHIDDRLRDVIQERIRILR